MKGNAVLRIDVAVEKGRHLGREAEGFIEGRAREAEFQEIRKNGQVRACPGQVAAAGLIPGVLQDRRHLPVVPHREELPVVPQERGGRQRFGQAHLGRLVHHDQIKIGFRPVQLPAPCGPLFEEPIQPTGCAPDDQQGLCQQLLPLLAGALRRRSRPARSTSTPAGTASSRSLQTLARRMGGNRSSWAVLAMAGQQLLHPLRHAVAAQYCTAACVLAATATRKGRAALRSAQARARMARPSVWLLPVPGGPCTTSTCSG